MLEILGHPNLFHEFVLVSIHACQVTNMGENVVKPICKLKSVNLAHSELHMGVYHQFGHFQNFSNQVESITKSRLFPLFGGQSFDGFEGEVVVEVEVVEVFAVDEEVEHVEALFDDLEAGFHPVDFGHLEKFCVGEGVEEGAFAEGFGDLVVELVEDPVFEKFLITNSDFNRQI